jgi:hypothetical protein
MQALTGGLFFVALVFALVLIPTWFPMDAKVASAATARGYNNTIAYYVVVVWSMLIVLTFAVLAFPDYLQFHDAKTSEKSQGLTPRVFELGKTHTLEILLVILVIFVAYFPSFLAKYGPYVEDQVFLNALHRMHAGQQPYVNFEFLYGPLMLYLPHFWISLFGYSMLSYYFFMAILEALVFVLLLIVVQQYVPQFYKRWAIFILVGIFLINALMAPNQNGLRKFLPVIAIIFLTSNPRSSRLVIFASALIGLQLAYSHEFGIASLVAIMAIYTLLILRNWEFKIYIPMMILSAFIALSTWFIVAFLLMGGGFGRYIAETLYLIKQFSAGEASFRFYWTANSLALFGLLCLACISVGRGFVHIRTYSIQQGDLLIFGGLVYTLVSLKGGLNRVDLWHLNPAFLMLIVAFVLPSERNLFTYSQRIQKFANSLIVIGAATYLLGLLPSGSFVARGWVNGLLDSVFTPPHPVVEVVKTRAPSVELEKSHPSPEILDMAEYLADSSRSDRPVLFYADVWKLGIFVGVYKTDFINDDFLYSEERGQDLGITLQENEDTIVIMRRPTYNRLFNITTSTDFPEFQYRYSNSFAKMLASWLSTVHYEGVETELDVKEARWKRTVGNYVFQHYEQMAEFGDYVVLMRKV